MRKNIRQSQLEKINSFILFGNSKRESARLVECVPEWLCPELSQFGTSPRPGLAQGHSDQTMGQNCALGGGEGLTSQ